MYFSLMCTVKSCQFSIPPPSFFCSSNNFALQAKRKTLAASDVLSALNDMEFDQFVPELERFRGGV